MKTQALVALLAIGAVSAASASRLSSGGIQRRQLGLPDVPNVTEEQFNQVLDDCYKEIGDEDVQALQNCVEEGIEEFEAENEEAAEELDEECDEKVEAGSCHMS